MLLLSNAIPNKWIEESFRGYSIAHEDRCQWLPGATDTDRTLKGSYILYVKARRAQRRRTAAVPALCRAVRNLVGRAYGKLSLL